MPETSDQIQPVVFKKAQGVHTTDTLGREYLDHCLNSGSLMLGHQHPAVVDALKSQCEQLFTNPVGHNNDLRDELSQLIANKLPKDWKVHFTTTGSEAVAHSIRLARHLTGREKVLKIDCAYHGNHDLSLVDLGPNGINKFANDVYQRVEWNNTEQVEDKLATGEFAAIIIEPVLRVFAADENFLSSVQTSAKKNDTLVIYDEVVCGWRFSAGPSRYFKKFQPDMICLGKIIGGGLPTAAIASSNDSIERLTQSEVYSSGTHFANPLSLTTGLATLRQLETADYEAFHQRCASFYDSLNDIIKKSGRSIHLLSYHSLFKLSFSQQSPKNPKQLLDTNSKIDMKFDIDLIKNGLMVNPGKRHFLTLAHQDNDLQKSLEIFQKTLNEFRE